MKVEQVFSDRKRFLDLLLLADEQEDMIDRYLERGDMFALYDEDKLRAVCVVTNEEEGIYELKNIATCPDSQRKGYGKSLIEYLFHHYSDRCSVMFVGTGVLHIRFYSINPADLFLPIVLRIFSPTIMIILFMRMASGSGIWFI